MKLRDSHINHCLKTTREKLEAFLKKLPRTSSVATFMEDCGACDPAPITAAITAFTVCAVLTDMMEEPDFADDAKDTVNADA